MNKRKTDNRGLTLIELIVVVAILGILSVGATNSLGLLSSTSAKETATKLKSAVTKTRTEAMSKSQASLQIYKQDSEYYVKLTVNGNEESPVKIGGSRVNVTYVQSDSSMEKAIDTTGLTLGFDRDTGAFQPINQSVGGTNVYCKKIIITSGSRTYTLVCERLTGKIRIE